MPVCLKSEMIKDVAKNIKKFWRMEASKNKCKYKANALSQSLSNEALR